MSVVRQMCKGGSTIIVDERRVTCKANLSSPKEGRLEQSNPIADGWKESHEALNATVVLLLPDSTRGTRETNGKVFQPTWGPMHR